MFEISKNDSKVVKLNFEQRKIKKDKKIIKAFQMKYLPNRISGKLDQKTLKISHYLASHRKILKKP